MDTCIHPVKTNRYPMILGAIDIGTNSIRMAIGQMLEEGRLDVLERYQRGIRLGQDTFRRGRLKADAIRTAVSILRDFQNTLRTYKADRVDVVATSAVREAANSDTFIDRVLMATGFDIRLISPAEESRLMASAVRQAIQPSRFPQGQTLLTEVGGGSTVLTVLKKGEIALIHSLGIGSIRIQEMLNTETDSPQRACELLRHHISATLSSIKGVIPLNKIQTFLAVGGDARWAASQVGKPSSVTGLIKMPCQGLDKLIRNHQDYSADELSRACQIPYLEAETLIPALLIYQAMAQAAHVNEILVSNASMRDGLLWDLGRQSRQTHDPAYEAEVLHSARAVGEKYHVDLPHAEQVMSLSVRLLEDIPMDQPVDPQSRLLLQAAALLHEVGAFVSTRSLHKHSYYIITNSELFGLTPTEINLVAHIARYHRRSRPKPTHIEYMALPRERRILVNRLAAILRVAEALDASRTQSLRNLTCKIDDEGMLIQVPDGVDLSLEQKDLESQSDMFEDIFGMKIRLEAMAIPFAAHPD